MRRLAKDDPAMPDLSKTAFPVTARNRVKRLRERASYDRDAVYAILDAGALAHLAYAIDGQPFCTPTLYWRDGDCLYWHGSSASRMLRHFSKGVEVCLTVSHLDGLVLARSAFHHSVNYRSAMCFGVARLVENAEEKARALAAFVDRLYPGRSATLRPMREPEANATAVAFMRIEEASAKTRAGGVNDDEEDYDVPVWAGVIPIGAAVGAAAPCERLAAGVAPGADLADYRDGATLDEALAAAQRRYEKAGG
jgi:nitroimidazol reductase NimA-like FMN-containing flavoprotein (pyridoxamine 5'-phosphate oxidase superfamily)